MSGVWRRRGHAAPKNGECSGRLASAQDVEGRRILAAVRAASAFGQCRLPGRGPRVDNADACGCRSQSETTMDDSRFDGLTRSLGSRHSRRHAAGALGGSALAGLFGRSGHETTAAKKKKSKPCRLKCPPGMIAAEGICVAGRGTCEESACGLPLASGRCNNALHCRCAMGVNSGIRCGKAPSNLACGQCTTDSQCASSLGPGAFCVLSTTDLQSLQCSCPTVGQGFCLLPC